MCTLALASARFVRFGPSHFEVFASTALLAAILVLIARPPDRFMTRNAICYLLAGILLSGELAAFAIGRAEGKPFFQQGLPMELCDITTFTAILALCFRWQLAYDLTYFWGLGGSLEAMITPDLKFDFPNVAFVIFFVEHAGVIVAVVFLTLALRMRPWPRSLLRATAGSQIYLVVAALIDWLANANYGFLRSKPTQASLFDYLGPWPFYIASLEIVVLVSFAICYLPFFVWDRLRTYYASAGR